MCTIAVFKNLFLGYPLVVAANRDELLDRPSAGPTIRDWNHNIFAPKDLQRGGTWNGVNGYGVFAGITNRLDVKSVRGESKRSRGELVMWALQHRTAESAFDQLNRLKGQNYNGFNLVISDKKNLYLLRGNGQVIESTMEEDGILIVTNQGIGLGGLKSSGARVNNVLTAWNRIKNECVVNGPSISSLKQLLDVHSEERYGTCINYPKENYGTKSSGIIHLKSEVDGDWWQYHHRERSSQDLHICEEEFKYMMRFPIIPRI